ncbi:hypothetical protein HY498_01495 [Candidatus Woesearchaeota archaeon]|nr:hypothetical protein [Candidatus Woesearchaeota archaeon]
MNTNPFKNLSITNHYKYLLVLAGFILIPSIFFDSKTIPQTKVVILCLFTILYGIIRWMRESDINERINQINLEWAKCSSEITSNENIAALINKNYTKKMDEFEGKYKLRSLLSIYQKTNWLIFIIYLGIMAYIILFV